MAPPIIKSISYDQTEIIKNIISLYCPGGVELDPTYSKGYFYRGIEPPKFKFDLTPQVEGVEQADCRDLPFNENTIESILFDPPFIGGVSTGNSKPGIIRERFGHYKNIPELWTMYREALEEFYLILKPGGILIFKCQDTIEHNKQYLSEYKILQEALDIGFYPKDKSLYYWPKID